MPLRVLVVDDNADTTEAFCILLPILGCDVRSARTAVDAFRLVREYDPGLLLLDIGLPDLNGYELARRLRASGATDLYIVALTGWCREEDRRRALDAGCDLHMAKPPDIDQVRAAIQAARLAMRERVRLVDVAGDFRGHA